MKIEPKVKLWLSSDTAEGIFGDGKWRLLMEIDKEHSIKKAAINLKISYRKAWGDLKKAEKELGMKLLEKKRGGNKGGITVLTEKGKKLINAWAKYQNEIKNKINNTFNKYIWNILDV